MSGWITVGLGTAAALCPLPGAGGPAVVVHTTPTTTHVVMCSADGWVEIGAPSRQRPAAPSSPPPASRPPRTPVPSTRAEQAAQAPRPVGAPPAPSPSGAPLPRPVEHRVPASEPLPEADAVVADPPAPAPALAPAPAPRAAPFRWVPRFHYGGGSARPAPAGLSTTMTTVVITTPAVLAAAALRPGSRRRNRG
ncbi:hypothetical protein G9272_02075 [Streptomyces asoensis]|uniref:Proline-rich protein n=1 Tax=Streptomyces asoensis TaxID=249586 RepID=A0A6M4WFA1_9ACTN|nr:hypothetical protein [Streptomyces asoensis]QJS99249.1 hypothetical protein G9272_02075 [Streptomyces asoensis]